MNNKNKNINRRDFLKATTATAAGLTWATALKPVWGGASTSPQRKKVVIIGIDGMDPNLAQSMMDAGKLPAFDKLRREGGYSKLGTSTPPQSPVAWASFINGAGPGSHGIFDFIHRNPDKQCAPFFSAADTIIGSGFWEVGDHRLQLPFWPFNHTPTKTVLKRGGTPFWDYLDAAGIESTFYDLPSNYPPSKSKHGHHRCLSGMGTPDLLGSYGTYQHFAEDGPLRPTDEGGGYRSMLFFESETTEAELIGPRNEFLTSPKPVKVKFQVHRDIDSDAAAIDIQNHKILLKKGQWSAWLKIDFEMVMPSFLPNEHVSGICRFYLQEVSPNFRLYVTPVNIDPSDPAVQITEPEKFIKEISQDLDLFYTTGFQEDHKALTNGVFSDDEYVTQTANVLEERFNLLNYATTNYDDGLLYFYFSSTDLQSHMFWWDSNDKHPLRSPVGAKHYFEHLQSVYSRMDKMIADILKRYGNDALVMVLSDHGFANFKRQFGVNTWLRDNGYLYPGNCNSILKDADWTRTRVYGLGINGIYLNLKGRERDGVVQPGPQSEQLLDELTAKLMAIRDTNGQPVIRNVYRSSRVYQGSETALAPDLVLGYYRGYRASWTTCLGDTEPEILSDNKSAWSADHCSDALEVPGVLFCNRPIKHASPALMDLAPSVLAEYSLARPDTMTGTNIFET